MTLALAGGPTSNAATKNAVAKPKPKAKPSKTAAPKTTATPVLPAPTIAARGKLTVGVGGLLTGLDPAAHLALGRALAPLRNEGVLIVGSGLSYHNLRQFGPSAKLASAAFDQWLQQAVVAATPAQRTSALLAWDAAPSARSAHPREEHLLPLMVAVGAAENEAGHCVYHEHDFMGGVTAASFRFGGV